MTLGFTYLHHVWTQDALHFRLQYMTIYESVMTGAIYRLTGGHSEHIANLRPLLELRDHSGPLTEHND